MPRYPIDRSTNFIVEDESWSVIEYDYTSVPGVIYLSLTENKVNLIYDDLKDDLADTDKLAKYEILIPNEPQDFVVNTIINPVFTLTKNGAPVDLEVELLPSDKVYARMIDGQLIAVKAGETSIVLRVKLYPTIQKLIPIVITEEQEEIFSAYIKGQDKIRLDSDATYELIGTSPIEGVVFFKINNELASIKVQDNICTVHTNAKNKLGSFTLTATYNGVDYEKEIKVIPLW